jgi:D-aminopeptidase
VAARLRDDKLGSLFEATVEATEEAILNALFTAGSMIGRDGNTRPALPVADVIRILNNYRPVNIGEE